jgi:hypothetical protein
MADTNIPDAALKIANRAKDVPWYKPDIGNKLGDSARQLLESYSGIPAEEVEEHVHKIVRIPVVCRGCWKSKIGSEKDLKFGRLTSGWNSVMRRGRYFRIHA